MGKPRILIVDDDPAFCLMLATFLEKNQYQSFKAHSGKECLAALIKSDFEMVLTDLRLPDISGIEVLKEIKKKDRELPVVLMTGYGEIRTAVQAMKLGAYEYVSKPVNPDEILMIVQSALSTPTEVVEQVDAWEFKYLTGTSEQAVKLQQYIELVAPTTMSVLIKGESGTGKEYVAQKIHRQSARRQGPFVALDCGALSNELAASELFGHVKGSFTGAVGDKVGQFQVAHGGTLFLDEIGNLSYEVQVKLLRALQQKTIKKVGGKEDIAVDVRIIAASNEDLRKAVSLRGFREDLYHRLNEFELEVPALRDRGKDIDLFADFFLKLSNRELNKQVSGFIPTVQSLFHRYSWPGNVREMKNIIKRAVLLCLGPKITEEQLPSELVYGDFEQFSTTEGGKDLRSRTESQERQIIVETLEKTRYNKSKAAELLKIDRKTLYNKIRQYGINN
jgi:two-component system response regulator HydG